MELRGLVSTALEKGKHIDDYEATAECVTAALNNIERSMNSHEYQAVSRDALALLFDDLLPLLGDPNTERAGERIILWADAAQLNGKAV
ncbi:MAG: hypothetical protein EOO22_04945 [Comamonadaceae bacterium]|nr:MAG: hypothetical protein EOO22_04945 [Comamonadaceae bacterium]